jgi:NTE family protein
VRSATNADLAAGYERVVVLAPITRGLRSAMGAVAHVTVLREHTVLREQAQVTLVTPDAAARRAIGRNVLDLARRAPAASRPYRS